MQDNAASASSVAAAMRYEVMRPPCGAGEEDIDRDAMTTLRNCESGLNMAGPISPLSCL
jgi:hypothetical protein